MASNSINDRLLSLALSAFLGTTFGVIFCFSFGLVDDSLAYAVFLGAHGAVPGAALGFVLGPVLDFASKRHANARNVWTIGLLTAAVSLLAGVVAAVLDQILVATGITMVIYVAVCIAVGLRAERRWRRLNDPSLCRGCGYSIVGLKSTTCPECGTLVRFGE